MDRAKERWQLIALSALKQSGRAYLPIVRDPLGFEDALGKLGSFDQGLVADPGADRTLDAISIAESVLVLLGPEGGFTSSELEAAAGAGFISFSLGKRILRAETASWVALTSILKNRGEI